MDADENNNKGKEGEEDEQDSQKLDDDSLPRRGKRGRDKVRTH